MIPESNWQTAVQEKLIGNEAFIVAISLAVHASILLKGHFSKRFQGWLHTIKIVHDSYVRHGRCDGIGW